MHPGVVCSPPSLITEIVLLDKRVAWSRFGLLEETALPRGVTSRSNLVGDILFGYIWLGIEYAGPSPNSYYLLLLVLVALIVAWKFSYRCSIFPELEVLEA